MNNKIFEVIKYEFFKIVKSKIFIIGTLLGPILYIGLMFVVIYLTEKSNDRSNDIINIGLLSNYQDSTTNSVISNLKNQGWNIVEYNNQDSLKQLTIRDSIKGYIVADSLDQYGYYSTNLTDRYINNTIENAVTATVREKYIKESGLTGEEISKILNPVVFQTYKFSEEDESAKSTDSKMEEASNFIISIIIAFLTLMLVMLYGQTIGRSVVTDKSSKIVDILLTSVNTKELLIGKIVGVGSAGILQFLVWVLGGFLFAVFSNKFSIDIPINLNGWYVLIIFVLFILGFILFSTIYAMFGALSDTDQNFNQISQAFTMITVMPFMILSPICTNPNSMFSIIMSEIPFFAPCTMGCRIVCGEVPIGQIALSLILLVLTIVIVVKISAKIFRIGIMTSGNYGFKDLIKWLKTKE